MHPLYTMPETFLPSRIFFLQYPLALARALSLLPRFFFLVPGSEVGRRAGGGGEGAIGVRNIL